MIAEHDQEIADALDRFQSYLGPPLNSWDDVLRDAGEGRGRPARWRVSWRSRRIAGVAIACTLVLLLPVTAIAITHWWFLPTPNSTSVSVSVPTPATGGPVEITRGQWNGVPWTLAGFISASRPQKVVNGEQTTEITLPASVCVALTPQGQTSGAAEGCGLIRGISSGISRPDDGWITDVSSPASDGFPAWAAGAVAPSVATLAWSLADGSTQRIPLIEGPSSFAGAVKFFSSPKPQNVDVTGIVALDENGNTLAQVPVP